MSRGLGDVYKRQLWNKPGVFTTDEFDPDPYMDALNKYGLPWVVDENPVLVD